MFESLSLELERKKGVLGTLGGGRSDELWLLWEKGMEIGRGEREREEVERGKRYR